MLRVKMLPSNRLAIIDDLTVTIFDASGNLVEETTLLPKYTSGMQALPVISVLTANDNVDVALFHDDIVEHVKDTFDGTTCAQNLMMNRGYIRMLQKKGKVDKVRYNQIVFIYPANFNVKSCLGILR